MSASCEANGKQTPLFENHGHKRLLLGMMMNYNRKLAAASHKSVVFVDVSPFPFGNIFRFQPFVNFFFCHPKTYNQSPPCNKNRPSACPQNEVCMFQSHEFSGALAVSFREARVVRTWRRVKTYHIITKDIGSRPKQAVKSSTNCKCNLGTGEMKIDLQSKLCRRIVTLTAAAWEGTS